MSNQLDFTGFVGEVFKSVDATRTGHTGGSYASGKWVPGIEADSPHTVNLQPATDKEIDFLSDGAERITDARRVYVNDGDLYYIAESDTWTFAGVDGVFKTMAADLRPWRGYARLIVARQDL